MFNSFQSGYTKHHSTETTLIVLHDDLIRVMDKQEVTCLTILDLSTAFDTIDHSILLHRLSLWFGLHSNVLSWFSSYLLDRTITVSCSGCKSSPIRLATGVSQGYVLTNPFNSLYYPPQLILSQPENHIHHLQAHDLPPKHHLYADDTQLHISFRPGNFSNAQLCKQRKIASISSWMTSNFLSLNPSKT